MADFCKQCSEEFFGINFEDLAGITSPEHTESGIYLQALCEGCVHALVDHTGKCVSKVCLHKHGNK